MLPPYGLACTGGYVRQSSRRMAEASSVFVASTAFFRSETVFGRFFGFLVDEELAALAAAPGIATIATRPPGKVMTDGAVRVDFAAAAALAAAAFTAPSAAAFASAAAVAGSGFFFFPPFFFASSSAFFLSLIHI